MRWQHSLCHLWLNMPTIVPFTCFGSSQSPETALPRPYPCCGWKIAPASFSGQYYCISAPMLCGSVPTVPTPFTLGRSTDCGNIYTYSNSTTPFYLTVELTLCSGSTGAVPPGTASVGIGPGGMVVVSPSCSKVESTYNFYMESNVIYGSAQIRVIVNQVSP